MKGSAQICHLHSSVSWLSEMEKKIIDSWDTNVFRNRLQKSIGKIDGSLELNLRSVCQFNAILQRNQNLHTLSPFRFPNVRILRMSYDDIWRIFEEYRICGSLSNKIVEAFP